MEKVRVYLSGGFRSNWQAEIIKNFSHKCIFYNPKENNLTKSIEYTTWDLFYVDQCDVVFAFMENSNPSGFGLSLEIGYAKAKGKTIILIDTKSELDKDFGNYFKIVKETSDVYYNNLKEGIEFLDKLVSSQIT